MASLKHEDSVNVLNNNSIQEEGPGGVKQTDGPSHRKLIGKNTTEDPQDLEKNTN